MDLPISPTSYAPSAAALTRAILRSDVELARTAAEVAELDGALAFSNPRRPNIYMVNFAAELRVAAGDTPAALLARVAAHYRAAGTRCWSLRTSDGAFPEPLAQAATAAGYHQDQAAVVYALEGYQRPDRLHPALQIIPSRAATAALRELRRRAASARYHLDDATAGHLADTDVDLLDEPRLESFLGRLDGRPVGAVEVLSLGDIGVITTVVTDPDFRRQRVAATLLAHAIDACQRSLFRKVVLETDVGNPAIHLYEALGFRRVGAIAKYVAW